MFWVGSGRWRGSEGNGGFPLRRKDARDVEKVGRMPVDGLEGMPAVYVGQKMHDIG